MEVITLLILLIGLIITVKIYVKRDTNNLTLQDLVKETFPKYIVKEKHKTIMICEINHRNEPQELIFIRIGNKKNIKKSGNMIIADYPSQPSAQEMKKDFGKYLN